MRGEHHPIRSFAIRFGWFSLPVLILLGLLEYQQRILPNNYSAKEVFLLTNRNQIQTVILGNSQSYMGINPHVMEHPAFNLSNTAQMLPYDYELLHKYHDSLPNLKRVYLGISYPSLYTVGNDLPGDFNRTYHYKHFLGLDAEANPIKTRYYSVVNDLTIKKSVDRMLAYYRGEDDLVEFDSLGWYTDSTQRDLDQNGLDACRSHQQYMSLDHKAHNLEQLDAIARLCDEHNYQLILFAPPMYQSYRDNMDPAFYADMVSTLEQFASSHQAVFLNLTEDSSYTAEDFFDSNHLREQGANKLTTLLDSVSSSSHLSLNQLP